MGSEHLRSMGRIALVAAALSAAVVAYSPTAAAQPSASDVETARNLMDVGHHKFDAGDYAAALEAYRGADAVMNVPSTGLGVGKALEKLGRLIEARAKFLEVSQLPAEPDEREPLRLAREEAGRLQIAIADRIPSLAIVVEGPGPDVPVTVTVDDDDLAAALVGLPRKLDPGVHTVKASAPGFAPAEETIQLVEKEQRVVTLQLEVPVATPLPPPPPDGNDSELPNNGLMWAGYGAAAGFIVIGSVTGGVSLAAASDAKAQCTGNICPTTAESDGSTSLATAHVSTVSFILAAVGAGVGTYGLLWGEGGLLNSGHDAGGADAASSTAVDLAPIVAPGFVGVTGRF